MQRAISLAIWRPLLSVAGLVLVAGALSCANSSEYDDSSNDKDDGGHTRTDGGKETGPGQRDTGPGIVIPTDGGEASSGPDLSTCEGARAAKSYIGCDYWPTVTYNSVWSIFDYALVVSNTGRTAATVKVTGGTFEQQVSVQPNELQTIYLPWVPELKGPDNICSQPQPDAWVSRRVNGGAYHLVSSHPVTVYQFSALQYAGKGGAPGKDWASCPGNRECHHIGCFSFTNDASLLLPSSAMTGNYRIATYDDSTRSSFTITATQDNTNVRIQASQQTLGGPGMNAIAAGDVATVMLNAGDVVQIVEDPDTGKSISGSIVNADKPVQVISGQGCATVPKGHFACDHIEESLFPAESLGTDYLITLQASPSDPNTPATGQIVRIVGNFDDTRLTFDPPLTVAGIRDGKITIGAGQVLDLGVVRKDFRVTSENHSFVVATFMLGAELLDGSGYRKKGDPAQSFATAIKQYRTDYLFLAPADYDQNFVNITGPRNAGITVDGVALPESQFTPVGSSGMGVWRHLLSASGSHTLKAQKPVGIQVYGYGNFTSYQYPGGTNLTAIAPPPIIR